MNAEPPQLASRDVPAARAAPPRPRPLVLPALAFMAGIILSEFLGLHPALIRSAVIVISIVALLLLLIFAAKRKGSPYLLHALIILAALGLGYARHQLAVYLPSNHVAHLLTDEPVLTRLAGRIVTQPTMTPAEKRNPFLPTDPSARTRFVLDATELHTTDPPTPITGFVRVSVEAQELDVEMGDTVVVTGKLYRPFGPRNPGETDWARWNRLQHVYASLSVEAPVHVRRVAGVQGGSVALFATARGYAQALLLEPFAADESDRPLRLLDAMVLGHRSAAGRQLNEAFLRTGTIHFLTVSGFHVGVLAGAVWYLLRRVCRRSARTVALVTMVVIALYALIVEHNAPILRATTMIMLLCLARLTRRPFCGFNWLALSALCVLVYNSFELFRAGFQLSFLQVLAIFTIVPYPYRRLVRRRRDEGVPADADTWPVLIAQQVWRWVAGLIVICVIAWAVSLPLVLFHFGRFAPWGALQSIVISPLVVLTIVLGFLTLTTQIVLPPLGAAAGLLLHYTTDLLLWAVEILGQLPGTLIETPSPPAALVITTYTLLILCLFMWLHLPVTHTEQMTWGRRETSPAPANLLKKIAVTSLAGVALACLWLGWLLLPPRTTAGTYTVHVLSVGSGSAVLITTPERHALLYDAGTMHNFDVGETVVRAAHALDIRRLDTAVLSHANYDHYSGVSTVLDAIPAGRLLFSPYFEPTASESPAVRRVLVSLPEESPPRLLGRAGDSFTFGAARFEILWPPDGLDETWECNDRSLVLRFVTNGRRVLLPGDVERDALRALLKLHEAGQIDLRSDVLIAPHHGAVVPLDTAHFYRAVNPRIVISSTSRERPKLTKMVRETLGENVRLISTRDAGAVTTRITPTGQIDVQTPFASPPQTAPRRE